MGGVSGFNFVNSQFDRGPFDMGNVASVVVG
jgi:hypothetical protein